MRRLIEREDGRFSTEGEALGVMLDHVFSCWGAMDGKLAARHKVFARDGWRCAVRAARMHVDAEPARSPHPLPLVPRPVGAENGAQARAAHGVTPGASASGTSWPVNSTPTGPWGRGSSRLLLKETLAGIGRAVSLV